MVKHGLWLEEAGGWMAAHLTVENTREQVIVLSILFLKFTVSSGTADRRVGSDERRDSRKK